jgi:hypothetical protein
MNIRQALKEKNKIVKDISDNTKKLQTYNSVEVGNKRPYSPVTLCGDIERLTASLIELKSKIHRANLPVFELIFEMSELKSNAKALAKMDCTEGKSNKDRYRMDSELVMESEISIRERDEMIKDLEGRIEAIQDKLDVHNAMTEI